TLGSLSVSTTSILSGLASLNGGLTIPTGQMLTNAGATLLSSKAIANHSTGRAIGTAATTVDVATTFDITQTTANQTLTLPNPTVTPSGRVVYINSASGNTVFTMYGVAITPGSSASFIWNGTSWVATSTGGNGVNSVGQLDTFTNAANGATISGSTIYLQSASASVSGLVNTSDGQHFAGTKTFDSLLTAGAGLTSTNGAIALTGNGASSLTTAAGALTLTSAAAATWSTTAGDLTLQAGSGQVSLGN